jgi:hypothetical protein
MKKLFFILVLLTVFNVNAQDLQKKIKFTAIVSENYFKRTDSVSLPTLSIIGKKSTLSIYQMVNMETDSSVVVKKLPKVQLVGYYQITQRLIFTRPEWNQSNVDAFGFKLFLCLK